MCDDINIINIFSCLIFGYSTYYLKYKYECYQFIAGLASSFLPLDELCS